MEDNGKSGHKYMNKDKSSPFLCMVSAAIWVRETGGNRNVVLPEEGENSVDSDKK